MANNTVIDAMWDDSPIDVSTEVNFIWSIANKLRGPYQSDKYKDVIIPMRDYEKKSVNSFTTRYSMIIIKAGGSCFCFQPYLHY